ncbi:MAG TPA: translocation/assembly module TamB domain-containing protein [Thermoanaerobaculia bacterium]|nr:translocation/assembly module TamB domain-containing protein [Thermoanaerobaculia bacterium]
MSAPERPRPGRLRRFVVRPFVWGIVLLAALLVGVYFLLGSDYTHRRAADLVVARLTEYLHRPVTVEGIDYTLFPPLSAELRGLVIPGPRKGDPPVATVKYVRLQLSWRSLRARILDLQQIEVVQPRLYIVFNADGSSNLPQFGSPGGGPSRFETRIGHILVQNGEFVLNERRFPLDLDASAVWGRMEGAGKNRLDALVTAQEVRTVLPDAHPYSTTLSAKGSLLLDQQRLRISSARLSGPDLTAKGNGSVTWKKGVQVDIRFEADGAAQLANRLGYLEPLISGAFHFDGGFVVSPKDWSWEGTVIAPRLDFLDRAATEVAAHLEGRPPGLRIDVQHAAYAGGAIAGRVDVDTITKTARGRPVALDLTFAGLDIEPLLTDQKVKLPGLSGEASGRLVYRLNSSALLLGSGRADVHLTAQQQGSGLPVSGDLPLTIDRGVLQGDALRLSAPGQTVTGSGSLSLERLAGRVDFHLDTQSAAAVSRLIESAGTPSPQPPFWLPTAGRGRVDGSLQFDRAGFSLGLDLNLQDVASPKLTADGLTGSLTLRPEAVEGLDLALVRGRSTLKLAGRVPFPGPRGKLPPGEQIAIRVDAADWPAASAAAFLLDNPPALEGVVTGRLDLSGTPDVLSGHADVRGSGLGVRGIAVGQASAAVSFVGSAVRIDNGVIEAPAGRILVNGSYDSAGDRVSATVDAPRLDLAKAPFDDLLGRANSPAGTVSVAAAVAGTLDRPQATLTLRGSGLELAGRALGDAGTAELMATWDGYGVRLAGSLLGLATFEGGGRLDRRGTELAIDLKSDNLPGLARLAAARPLPAFTGSLTGRATFDADWGSGKYRGELALSDLRAQYQGREIRNLEPVDVTLDPGRLLIRSFYLGEPEHDTDLFLSGSVGLGGPRTPLDLHLQSSIWAGWSKLFVPDLDLSGYLDVLATVRGNLADPAVSGEGVLRGARLIVPSLPHSFDNITGTVLFERGELVLDDLRSELGGGTLRLSGRMSLPVAGRPLAYQLLAAARNVTLRYPEGFLTRGNADLSLSSAESGRLIRGSVELDRAYYLQDVQVGTLELLQRVFQRQRIEVAQTSDFLSTTQLNVSISGPNVLRVRNNVADVHGSIDLTLRGSLARPVVFGRVELEPGGKLTYADNEYKIERGLLTFANPYKVDPVIDLVATTEVQNFAITLNLSGTIERLDARFSSNADLADLEILALLASGQELPQKGGQLFAPPTPGANQQPAVGAQGFLYGQAASVISTRVSTLFGLDRFRINPVAASAGESVTGVGVTVGKRLSKDIFITYSTDPSSARQNILQVQWHVSPKFTVLLTQTGSSYAVDGQWERRF